MKRGILCLAAILLLSVACEKQCLTQRPKDVKPIDWGDYNDVYTVYWNYHTLCSETKEEDRGKEIMIYGWMQPGWDGVSVSASMFALKDDRNDIILASIDIKTVVNSLEYDSIQTKLNSCDLAKKCFIKGRLDFHCLHIQGWSKAVAGIYLENVNDIYFEE